MFLSNFFKKSDTSEKLRKMVERNSPIAGDVFTTEFLGLEIYDASIASLIEIGELVPVKRSYTFSTTEDEQDQIILKLCRGKELDINKVVRLGQYQIINIPKLPAKEPSIEVTFRIENKEISITALDLINEKYLEVIKINNN